MSLTYEIHTDWKHSLEDAVYTCFCAWPGTPRGHYDEEIDVIVRGGGGRRVNMEEVRRVAQRQLDNTEEYEPGGKVKRIARSGI